MRNHLGIGNHDDEDAEGGDGDDDDDDDDDDHVDNENKKKDGKDINTNHVENHDPQAHHASRGRTDFQPPP
ncbi:hypothetical protein E4U42_002165, partial [Claviceps africana]